MRKINSIVIHCSAGYGDIPSMQRFWRSLGWKTDGYHLVIDLEGEIHDLVPFEKPSNGVKGHNGDTIHICYIGGVERGNVNRAKDTRTLEQKISIIKAIKRVQKFLEDKGQNIADIEIKGHRDFSPDLNGDGVIASWERIKECPSFDAIPEYLHLVPLKKSKVTTTYTVVSGDTLLDISRKFNTTVTKIMQDNKLSSTLIKVGQKLKI